MQRLSYVLAMAVIYPLSLLPFRALYFLSDGLFLLFYYVIGYRKKVVMSNLERAFPGRTASERQAIARKFYHHFTDLLVESFKGFTISRQQLQQRMYFENPELVHQYFHQGRHVTLIGAHYNNWEYLPPLLSLALKHTMMGIYKPLSNPYFDRAVQRTRGRYGLVLVPMKEVKSYFERYSSAPMALGFLADQSPSRSSKPYWTTFLGCQTPVLYGAELYAKRYDAPVIYIHVHKIKRGFYTLKAELITEHPSDTPKGFITEAHTKLLETDILQEPAYWLWSHKRWKLVPDEKQPRKD